MEIRIGNYEYNLEIGNLTSSQRQAKREFGILVIDSNIQINQKSLHNIGMIEISTLT